MFSRNLARVQRVLKGGNIQPKDRHNERKGDRREEIQVLRCFVAYWWVLEDAETASSDRH